MVDGTAVAQCLREHPTGPIKGPDRSGDIALCVSLDFCLAGSRSWVLILEGSTFQPQVGDCFKTQNKLKTISKGFVPGDML